MAGDRDSCPYHSTIANDDTDGHFRHTALTSAHKHTVNVPLNTKILAGYCTRLLSAPSLSAVLKKLDLTRQKQTRTHKLKDTQNTK